MKKMSRFISLFLALSIIFSLLPLGAFAAPVDSDGKPTDVSGQVFLAIYTAGNTFPGEPASYPTENYKCLGSDFQVVSASTPFSTDGTQVLKPKLVNNLTKGGTGIWGVTSTTGGSDYLLPASGLVNEDGTHNAENEAKIVMSIKGCTAEEAKYYTIIWYVIKHESDRSWHIDGLIVEKETFSVNYYGNGNTGGSAPTGVHGLLEGDTYMVAAKPDDLVRVDPVTGLEYSFVGWSTTADGTGQTYAAGSEILVTESISLYAKWYLPTVHTITVVTNLDGTPTDVEHIHSHDVEGVFASMNGGQTFVSLPKTAAGTYSGSVTENGIYDIYFLHGDGTYEPAHGHQVVIYNESGKTELQNYSITYDTAGGVWAEGQDPGVTASHAYTAPVATANVPTREGYVFAGWLDQNGKAVTPGGQITDSLTEKTVLTAQWERLENITVNIVINHGTDETDSKADAGYQLLHIHDGLNHPMGDAVSLTPESCSGWTYAYDAATNTSTYTAQGYNHTSMPAGDYNVSAIKAHYEDEVVITQDENGDTVITITYDYAPDDFDLEFDVEVDASVPATLYPQAVNVRLSYWGVKDGVYGWYPISQHDEASEPPVSVIIDPATGKGHGFYTVHKYNAQGTAGRFRVSVSSYVLPDGTVVAAQSDDLVLYTGSIYQGTVTVPSSANGDGSVPDGTTLVGAYYDDTADAQMGRPLVTVKVMPYAVVFDANGGTLGTEEFLKLEDQYRYPDLDAYVPVHPDSRAQFAGWYLDEACTQPAENQKGQYIAADITYYAKWKVPMTVKGTVYAEGTYVQNGETVVINDVDRAKQVMVVLQRYTDGAYNDVAAQLVTLGAYDENHIATGQYSFADLDQDGSTYRVHVLLLNFDDRYDNEAEPGLDGVFTEEEATAVLGADHIAQVDVHLDMAPELYTQYLKVDATQIAEGFRPDSALSEIHYRDLGTNSAYQVIQQHVLPPYGVETVLHSGVGTGSYDVWRYHTNGTLYQYQMEVTKLYGSLPGVFEPTGTAYVPGSAPYTIQYSAPSYYDEDYDGQAKWITATLVPNRYRVNFALGLEEGETVKGMDEFHIDAGENVAYHYAYTHTWSYGANLVAFPYRAGYIFTGWQVAQEDVGSVAVNNHGYVTVAPGLDHDVTLTATWQKVEEDTIGYAVRYLKSGTTQVLHGAKVVECAAGTVVTAAAEAGSVVIPGYEFDYASQDTITVTGPVADHVLTLYYKESGVSEQVDSNLQMDKTATLEDNGTYTIWMETFTKDNPITTLVRQDTPLDIVMVLDQSGSIIQQGYLDELQDSVAAFVTHIADHGRDHEVDHRIAIVGYAGDEDEPPTSTDTSQYPIAGGNTSQWVNTGLFDSNGVFHPYPVTGFIYTRYTGQLSADGTYYVRDVDGNYMLLRHHDEYRHLITEEEAKLAVMEGTTVYGYQNHEFVALTRNLSGLWTYTGSDGLVQLYSLPEFFTYHQDVWTHRNGMERRNIHAYGTGDSYVCTDGHDEVYTRAETTGSTYDLSVYADALVPVSVGANGSGGTHPGLLKSSQTLASNGGTFTQYGIEMANRIFAANNSAADQERVRIMVLFSDGLPGIGTFDETEANAALAKAKVTKNEYGAYVYTVGLYPNTAVDSESDVAIFMNGVSSNYPNAENMDDVYVDGSIASASSGMALNDGRTYYARTGYAWWGGYTYHELQYQEGTGWYYTYNSRNVVVSTDYNATTNSSGNVGNTRIYYNTGGYVATDRSGYYSTTQSVDDLSGYFEHIVDEITTKITQEIVLHEDTILRDIMGQGLVLTGDTVIKVYTQDGTYNAETQSIDWAVDANGDPVLSEPIAVLDMGGGSTKSEEEVEITYTDEDGNQVTKTVSRITVHNWDSENPTNPAGENYHPHTVDITGYAFDDWYISDLHPNGKKMLVEITRVEARDEVEWGRSTATNHKDSGLWLPADAENNRELLLPFDQPTTIFVERAYVLDYAKSFDLSGWYYDGKDESDTTTGAVHVDPAISDGMNWFDTTKPGNSVSTRYGNISVDAEGKVSYRPTKMNWGEYDQFYVFGDTWRNTVVSQDANENGNLWSKVSVIPASSVYYEDSFVTDSENGIEGFQFTGTWEIVASDGADANTETPEHLEGSPYGDVHGWIDSMVDDAGFSDGSAHGTGLDGQTGAGVSFTFTGTGVDVYTRTNINSGYIMAILYDVTGEKQVMKKGLFVDNLAASGDYYQIPTVSFMGLSYGSYKVQIIANKKYALDLDTLESLDGSDGGEPQYRTEYYLDGIRVYNPLGSDQTTENSDTAADTVVKDAYGKELNSVFTEVRDILLDNSSFTADQTAGTGAVFVDWIREGQGEGNDAPGTAQDSAQVGTYESLGPKNEVYLAPGQAVVLKVDPANTYYVGMKKLTADKAQTVTVHVSGTTDGHIPVTIPVGHTTDQSYQVSPDADGYIIIANDGASGDILSLTKLRTANNLAFVGNGVQTVAVQEVAPVMARFSLRLMKRNEAPEITPEETIPEETIPEETIPEETTPVAPEETIPEETIPEETIPETTIPEETTPEETQSDVPAGPSEETLRKDAVAKELFGNVRTWLQK